MDITQIQREMIDNGSHWWDYDTMRMFGCRVVSPVYSGTRGIYFVSSEWDGFTGRENNRRAFTVRKYDQGTISTIGDMGGWGNRADAVREAKILAGENVTEDNTPLQPVTQDQQFQHELNKYADGATLKQVRRLRTLATQHHRLMEDYCNGVEVYDSEGEALPKLQKCREKLGRLAADIGCKGVIFSGDPRGCTVRLTFRDGETNDFAKEGWCVPLFE